MNIFDIVMKYNDNNDFDVNDLLADLSNSLEMSIDSSVLYWFSEDICKKNDILKPISFIEKNGEYFFFCDNKKIFSINKNDGNFLSTLKSPLRTTILPLFDCKSCYFSNDQFITGDFGLYEDYSSNKDFSSYRYLTFDSSNRLLNEYFINLSDNKMEKNHYDKSGVIKTKYLYDINKKESMCDEASTIINKVSKFIDEEYPNYNKHKKEKMFYECIDGYFYDIKLVDKKYKYKDFYVSKHSKIFSKKDYDYFMESCHIDGVRNRNIEKYFCKSNIYNSNIKLLAISDFVNGYMLKNKIIKTPILEMQSLLENIDYSDSKDDSVLLNKYESKLSEINKLLFEKIQKFSKKHKRKTKNRVIGSAFGSILVGNEKTFIYNCGDTRIYSLKNGELISLTCDDTVVWDMYRDDKISRDEASQFQKGAKLTRFMGQTSELSRDIITINNDEYDKLYIFSDGITDSINESTIETIISVNNDEDILNNIIVHASKNRSKYEDVTGCCYSKKIR